MKNFVKNKDIIDNKGPWVLSLKSCAFFDMYNPNASDAPSDIANDIILAIKNTGFIDVCDIPANNPVVVTTPEFNPKKNPCLNDAKSNPFIILYIFT